MKYYYIAVICVVLACTGCATARTTVDDYEAFTYIDKLTIEPDRTMSGYMATMPFLRYDETTFSKMVFGNTVFDIALTDNRYIRDGIELSYEFSAKGKVLERCSIRHTASDFMEWSDDIVSRWRDSGDAIMVSSEAVRESTGGALLAVNFSTFREGIGDVFYYRITQRLSCFGDSASLSLNIDYVYEQVH